MQSFIERIRAFMSGRNGLDKLSFFTIIVYLLLNGIKTFFFRVPAVYYTLWVIAVAFLALTFFRILSKNLTKRRNEAARFEEFLARARLSDFTFKMKKKLNRLAMRASQFKTHRFRTCPQCREHLRLSKKRGKRSITCPRCGRKFTAYVLF